MRTVKRTVSRIYVMVSIFLVCIMLSNCVSPASMVNEAKKKIPDVIQFVEEYGESLSTIIGIQNRIADVLYVFDRDDNMEVIDFSEGV